ncbi:MAG TPA: hypothetical protein G4N96_01880 [Chloroflexi bacterium]|nr:MAG: hypothetical protein B6243_04160 [Anaerolineaceae bacterium 4572_5.2]HEY83851.1 hypothetical protein [Chloroflexota bacterium]
MIDLKVVKQIQQTSIAERIQIVEYVLQSLKRDIKTETTDEKPEFKSFNVRQVNLGKDVQVDRDIVYAERLTGEEFDFLEVINPLQQEST